MEPYRPPLVASRAQELLGNSSGAANDAGTVPAVFLPVPNPPPSAVLPSGQTPSAGGISLAPSSTPYQPFNLTNTIPTSSTPTSAADDSLTNPLRGPSTSATPPLPATVPPTALPPSLPHISSLPSSTRYSPLNICPSPSKAFTSGASQGVHTASPAATVLGLAYDPFRSVINNTNSPEKPSARKALIERQGSIEQDPARPPLPVTTSTTSYNPLLHTSTPPATSPVPASIVQSSAASSAYQPLAQVQTTITIAPVAPAVPPGPLQHILCARSSAPTPGAAVAAPPRSTTFPRAHALHIVERAAAATAAAASASSAAVGTTERAIAPEANGAGTAAAARTVLPPAIPAVLQASGKAMDAPAGARAEDLLQEVPGPGVGTETQTPDPGGLPPAGAADQLDRVRLREQAQMLHDMVGGMFDVATCEDVLVQMGGDANRAARFMLDGTVDETAGPSAAGPSSGPQMPPLGAAADADGFAAHTGNGWVSCVDGCQPRPHEHGGTGCFAEPETKAAGAGCSGGQQSVGTWDDCPPPPEAFTASAGPTAWTGEAGVGTWDDLPPPQAHVAKAGPPDWSPQAGGSALGGRVGAGADEPTAGTRRASGGVAAEGDMAEEGTYYNDGWFAMGEAEGEPLEDKLGELRIYFPQVEETELRTVLEALNGDVQQALQLLGDLHEEEAYRRIEIARQDAELAKKLQEQAVGSSPSGSSPNPLHAASASADALLAGIDGDEIIAQMDYLALAEQRRQASEASIGGATTSNRQRVGLKLLLHLFGLDVDEDLLAAVLNEHGGDVEAARAALHSMGLVERPAQQQQQAARRQQQNHPAGAAPEPEPWSVASMEEADEDETGSELMSRRGLPAAVSGRWSAPMLYPESSLVGGAELPSNAAVLGPPRLSGTQIGQTAPASASLARSTAIAAAGVSGGPHRPNGLATGGSGAGPSGSGFSGWGPIRLLAAIGIDFQCMGYSDETLECIRVAFNNARLRDVIEKVLCAEAAERSALGMGSRPGRGGLTSSDKQALWDHHRELPLALTSLRNLLLQGARAAEAANAQATRRLVSELRRAAKQLEGQVREQHQAASNRIFSSMNAALGQEWKVDLHGLMPHEALQKLERQLASLRNMGAAVTWTIITGKGLHSRGDGPKLPALVDEWLERKGLAGMPLPGAVQVRLTPEVYEQLAAAEAAAEQGGGMGSGTEGTSGMGLGAFTGLASAGR